jgi:L-rhamnonate dehydratase
VEVETASGLTGHGFTAITNSPLVVSVIRDVITADITGQDALAPRDGSAPARSAN